MLFEISCLNRLYKTNLFFSIKPRVMESFQVFVITKDQKYNHHLELIDNKQKLVIIDISKICEMYKTNQEYSKEQISLLYFAECCFEIAIKNSFIQEIQLSNIRKLIPIISNFYNINYRNEKEIQNSLESLNQLLLFQNTIGISNRISIVDVLCMSGIIKLYGLSNFPEKYSNIKRWKDWIYILLGVDYIRISKHTLNSEEETKHKFACLSSSKTLINAILEQNYDQVKILLSQGANPNSIETKRNLHILHITCEKGDLRTSKILIEHGAKIDALDKDKMSPLFYAVKSGNVELCDYLIEKGSNIEHEEVMQRTVFYWAASEGNIKMMNYLQEKGANPNVVSKLGRTALSKACWNGEIEIVKILLKNSEININFKDKNGRTALHNAVWGCDGGKEGIKMSTTQKESPEIALLLIEHNADKNIQDKYGYSPVHIAASTNAPKSLKILIEKGADLNLLINSGGTVMHTACKRSQMESMEILLNIGFSLFPKNKEGNTPFQLSIKINQYKFIENILLKSSSSNYLKIRENILNERSFAICLDYHCLQTFQVLLNEKLKEQNNENFVNNLIFRCLCTSSFEILQFLLFSTNYEIFNSTNCELTEIFIALLQGEYNEKIIKQIEKLNFISFNLIKACIFSGNEEIIQYLFANNKKLIETNECRYSTDLLFTLYKAKSYPIKGCYNKLKIFNEWIEIKFKNYNLIELILILNKESILKILVDNNNEYLFSIGKDGYSPLIEIIKNGKVGIFYDIIMKCQKNMSKDEFDKYLNYKDSKGNSALDYCFLLKKQFKYEALSLIESTGRKLLNIEYKFNEFPKELINRIEAYLKWASEVQSLHKTCSFDKLNLCEYKLIGKFLNLYPNTSNWNKSIPSPQDNPVIFIDRVGDLEKVAKEILEKEFIIGIDLEYYDTENNQIGCSLIQISILRQDFIIDSMVLHQNINPILGPLFENTQIIKIFHGCDSDIQILLSNFGIIARNIFDTARAFYEIEIEIETSAIKNAIQIKSLQYLIKNICGVKIEKLFQFADWRIRPLPDSMIDYARNDTHFLIYIYLFLTESLVGNETVVPSDSEIKQTKIFKKNKLQDFCIEMITFASNKYTRALKKCKMVTLLVKP